ncbi:MAG: hypothetical protein K8J09_11250 [Planctomycetes bacterium]|nr:hypothetical protein [Planctomycetota bacterium]MCC7399635.1 hypothetical protein [Planctomycetota bacterium]
MNERTALAGWPTTLVVTIVAAAGYLLLHQRAMHGEDTRLFVMWLDAGPHGDVGALPRHFLFLPLLHGIGGLLRPCGLSWFEVLWSTAAVGAALGLGCLYRAARQLVPAGASPLWLPLALAVVPTWFFFATAAEIHGLFVLPLGLAWWSFACYQERPHPLRALLVGLPSGAAAALHFSGHFLLPALWLTAVCLRPRSLGRQLGHGCAMAFGHFAALASLALLVGVVPWVQFTAAQSFAGSWSAIFVAAELPVVGWEELVRPFLPWSALAVFALFVRMARPWALAAFATLAVHAPLPLTILSHLGHLHEHGAYAIAFAVPAVLAALHTLPRWWFGGAVALSLVLAVLLQAPRLTQIADATFVAGLHELTTERGPVVLLVGSYSDDMESLTILDEHQPYVDSDKIKAWVDYGKPAGVPLPLWFDEMVRALGRPLFVCDSAYDRLQRYDDADIHALWPQHVATTYVVERVERRGLGGYLLQKRSR